MSLALRSAILKCMGRSEPSGLGALEAGDACREIAESVGAPAIVLDESYVIRAANRPYRERYGDGGDVVGRRCHEILHHYAAPCDEVGESCPLREVRASGQPHRVVHLHYDPNGASEHHDVTARAIGRTADGERCFLEVIEPLFVGAASRKVGLVGRSPAFTRMLELIRRAAPSETTILVGGESGTGKELVARTIHDESHRKDGPFVPLECSGLSETLFESELFGHEKGAFTGATGRKRGLVEMAQGGTLFLDEVGDIPLGMQVKLLRLLESRTFRRVGSVDLLRADFRLVCATNRDLRVMLADGTFRRDLYYRIVTFVVGVPPLRARVQDIPLLVERLRRRLNSLQGCELAPETLEILERYRFPGNIRELFNILERARLLVDGDAILPCHLPEEVLAETSGVPRRVRSLDSGRIASLEEMERGYLQWAAAVHTGDRRELALKLGVSERTLYRKLRELGEVLSDGRD